MEDGVKYICHQDKTAAEFPLQSNQTHVITKRTKKKSKMLKRTVNKCTNILLTHTHAHTHTSTFCTESMVQDIETDCPVVTVSRACWCSVRVSVCSPDQGDHMVHTPRWSQVS